MFEDRAHVEKQALLSHGRSSSLSSSDDSRSFASDVELDDLDDASFRAYQQSRRPKWWRISRTDSKVVKPPILPQRLPRAARRRSTYHRIWRLILYTPYLLLALLVITGVFFPSYTTPPQRYTALRERVLKSTREGAANPHNEKIFVAASLYDRDGALLRGDWGRSLLHLIDILGHNNVFVSIYENDPSDDAILAMSDFRDRLPCESSIVHEDLDTSNLDHVTTADGQRRLKRMAFLADVRNRALRPLDDENSPAYTTNWDKLLYLNDIVFDPIDAASLLLNTNVDPRTGRTDYRAACAVDFINPFKFYDTFATRDAEGYDMGVPFYPWFTNAGKGESRRDVLGQRDAVRVRSCWGGMVAFEGKWFQGRRRGASATPTAADGITRAGSSDAQRTAHSHDLLRSPSAATNASIPQPLRFRSEPATYWDASECCLIHADLAQLTSSPLSDPSSPDGAGIYLNPYIRVAYSTSTLRWLHFTRRFERLYPYVHSAVNWIGGRPGVNERQFDVVGTDVGHWVWRWGGEGVGVVGEDGDVVHDGPMEGRYVCETETVRPGMFCGTRKLQVLKTRGEGKGWGSEVVPAVPALPGR